MIFQCFVVCCLLYRSLVISSLSARSEPWVKRLSLPNYRVGEAARYAHIGTGTIRSWQRLRGNKPAAASARDKGAALSYLQLIEVAVIAACRKAGMTLSAIRDARNYVSKEFGTEYPFAMHQFATDGKRLLWQGNWGDSPDSRRWLSANENGQGAWDEVIGRTLKSFEYERDLAVTWRPEGAGSPILIDPRIAFGAPNVSGIPTAVFKERWLSGEPIKDTASDFDVKVALVRNALQFEAIDPDAAQPSPWLH